MSSLKAIMIHPIRAEITHADGADPLTVDFSATYAGASEYIWDFGDGTVVTNGPTFVHTYAEAGTYTVTVTYLDDFGEEVIGIDV